MRTAKPYPDLFIKAVRCIGKIDGKYLAAFLVRQAEQVLYLVELVLILPLVEQYFAVTVVDNRLFHNGGRDNIIHFLRHYNRLSVNESFQSYGSSNFKFLSNRNQLIVTSI